MERAKRKAAEDGRSLTALIEEAVRRVLNDRGPEATSPRVLPPVSKAMGGLMPGIDLHDSASLQEMDDLDWLRRQQ